jgi:Hypothetical glycosyl hydrolase family 15
MSAAPLAGRPELNDITRRNALGGLVAGAAGAAEARLLGRRGELGARTVPARSLATPTGVRNRPYWLHLDSSPISQATINTEAPRRSWIAFNAWEGGYIPAFRAAGASNPYLELYVYKDFSSTRSGDPGPKGETSGALLYSWVSANHPGWFLTRSGQRIPWQGYSHTYAMNIGNPAYQQACRDAIVSDLKKNGWNGVFLDNILYSINQYAVAPCDQYSSDSAFQAAYKSAIGVICSGITAAGFKIIGNMSGIRTRPGLWDAYINAGMAGGFDEWFLCFGDGQELADYGSPPEGFIAQVNEVKYLMYGAKPYLPGGFQAHSLTNTQSFRYAFAGWLLGVSTPAFFSEAPSSYGPPPQWRAEYDWNFGSFTGPYTTLQPSVYQRIFTNGMALVNANSSGSNVTVNLANADGTVYLDQGGVSRTFVVLPPRTGMALRKVR